ncbi:MAG: Ger(x)C family spore germination protein [Eubacteriales bacterium]
MLWIKKFSLVLMVICITFILSGCWDQVEINDNAFVIALGIDYEDDQLSVTYSFPNLPVITNQGGDGPQSFTKNIKAPTLYEANKIFGTRSKNQLNFGHAKVIIFGEDVLSNEKVFKQVIDQLERDPSFARTLIVFGTEDKASDLLEEEIKEKQDIGMYIYDIYQNNENDVMKTTEINLNNLISSVEEDGILLIPKVLVEEEEPSVEGASVVINFTLEDWMDRNNVEKLSWMINKGAGTKVKVPFNNKDQEVTVEFAKFDTNFKFRDKNGQVSIEIKIQTEGDVTAYTVNPENSLFDENNIIKLEKKVNDEIEKETNKIVSEVQEKYKVDLFDFINELAVENRDLWLKYNNWDEIFSNAKIEVTAQSNIRRIGVAK